jgi:spore germination protein YaaH
MKTSSLVFLSQILLFPVFALAQQDAGHKSIHQLEAERHRNDTVSVPVELSVVIPPLPKTQRAVFLDKKVYGWHPYWALSGAYLKYDYAALSHIAYFSYETDTATGGYTTIRGWDTTPIIAYAHQRGVKVTLTVTNFGYDQNDKLLGDTLKQGRMFDTLVLLLKAGNGDGVNFDLEGIRNTQRANLVSFMRRAVACIKAELPNAEISMATPAVDWSGTWDFAQLGRICDYLIVMGYDYYWSGSTTAGPVAPLEGESYNITRTIDTYLAAGVPRAKLLLGVPWYGLDWPVVSSARKSSATGTASSRTYAVAEPMAMSSGKVFDGSTKVPWFAYTAGTVWRQVWYDDSLSLALKYALVNSRALAGIGIWALSHDGARSEIWNGIKSAFLSTDVETAAGDVPQQPALLQNYPNPFNGATVIRYQVPAPGPGHDRGVEGPLVGSQWPVISLRVFDLPGREVAVLVNERKPAGTHEARFDAHGLASGVYVYRLTAGNFVQTRRMILIQ